MHKELSGWVFITLIVSNTIVCSFSFPNGQAVDQVSSETGFYSSRSIPRYPEPEARKLAVKSNSIKKVALDDVEDLQTNQISETGGGGFSWSNLLGVLIYLNNRKY